MGHASIRRIDNNKKLKGLLSPIGKPSNPL